MRDRGKRLIRKEVKLPERLVVHCEEYIREKGLFSFNELVRLALFLLLEEKPVETAGNTFSDRNHG